MDVAFVGPSASPEELRARLPSLVIRPPAAWGDALHAVEQGARRLLILDGPLLSACPVGHVELISVLERDVRIVGAASLGAIRAVELSGYGMEGVGWVFRALRRGWIRADADLAVACDPDTWAARSLPLVQVRYAAHTAIPKLTRQEQRGTLAAAQAIYFPHRTWSTLARALARRGGPLGSQAEDLVNRLAAAPDIKRADALMAVDALTGAPTSTRPNGR